MNVEVDPWVVAVGQFVLAFGDIENSTLLLLGCMPECKIPRTAPELELSKRFGLLMECLEQRPHDEDYVEALAALQKAKALLTHRNLIAHNGLSFTIIHKEGNQLVIGSELISPRRKAYRLSLAQTQRLAIDAQRAALDLSNAAVNVARLFVDFA